MDKFTKDLTVDLRSFDARRRESALACIRVLPEKDAIDLIVDLMEAHFDDRYAKWASNILFHIMFYVAMIVAFLTARHFFLFPFIAGIVAGLTAVIITMPAYSLYKRIGKNLQWVTPLLSEYSDARLLTLCLTEWKASKGEKRVNLLNGLVRNLPLLTYDFAEGLSTENRRQLRELVWVESPNLQRTTLEALLRIEDTAAIPYVAALLKKTHNDPVREARESCLSGLLELKQKEKDRKVLLRASVEENGKEILLRPATSHNDEDEQQLLRPGSKE